MLLFISHKKVKNCLSKNNPQLCVEKFGLRGRRHYQTLAFSDDETLDLRKKAIEALVRVGIDYSNDNCSHLIRIMEGLDEELRNYFIQLTTSEIAHNDTRKFLVVLFSKSSVIADDRILSVSVENWLKDSGLNESFRVSCVNMILGQQKNNAKKILLEVLNETDTLHYRNRIFYERVISALIEINATGEDVEHALLKKLHEIYFTGAESVELLLINGNHQKLLEPYKKILSILSNIGGTNTLDTMISFLNEKGDWIKISIPLGDDSTGKTVLANTEFIANEFIILLRHSINNLNRRLYNAGAFSTSQSTVETDKKVNNIHKIGLLFDIDGLLKVKDGGNYGVTAYNIIFDTIVTLDFVGCSLYDGDTTETLKGLKRNYCFALETSDITKIEKFKKIFSSSSAKGLLPLSDRFIYDLQVSSEPLVLLARIDNTGTLVDCSDDSYVMEVWKKLGKKEKLDK